MEEIVKSDSITNLAKLGLHQKGKVIEVNSEKKEVKRRLLDMGLTRGTTVKVENIAPFGDPITISVRGYFLCLRSSDLKLIKVEVLS
ncbi:MAG: ferrous iron transport protein A [Acholeplasmatales bacterium]|jgi:ferrous iron transport protein A|nr:ferrous iron transport protein A [Acholeplasmatales bacterium]